MPFGLTNAPTTFQSTMNRVFQPKLRKFVLVFFDDILIYSTDWSHHLRHLESVLHILAQNQLYAKLKKCEFGKNQLQYLGHIISPDGVRVDPKKVSAIVSWPTPKNLTQLWSFLGLTSFYRSFIASYASVTTPLIDLLHKDSFLFSLQNKLATNLQW